MAQHNCGYILQSNSTCTTVCCPAPEETSHPFVHPFKKERKFINLTINKHREPAKLVGAVVPQPDLQSKLPSTSSIEVSEELFKQEKSSFLQQIRNYSPQLPNLQSRQKQPKELDTTKELTSSRKNLENHTLSNLLQSLSSEIFSEMFVSSAVKGKVVLSGSLGSISEVKSQMELSNQTETFLGNVHYHQQK